MREGRAHAALDYDGAQCVGGVTTDLPKSCRAASTGRLFGGAGTNDPAGATRASSSGARKASGVRTPASPTLTLLKRAMV